MATTDVFQPLSIDTNIEYQLDMARFPGWEDLETRLCPTLLLHKPTDCTCQLRTQGLESDISSTHDVEAELNLLIELYRGEQDIQTHGTDKLQDTQPFLESSDDTIKQDSQSQPSLESIGVTIEQDSQSSLESLDDTEQLYRDIDSISSYSSSGYFTLSTSLPTGSAQLLPKHVDSGSNGGDILDILCDPLDLIQGNSNNDIVDPLIIDDAFYDQGSSVFSEAGDFFDLIIEDSLSLISQGSTVPPDEDVRKRKRSDDHDDSPSKRRHHVDLEATQLFEHLSSMLPRQSEKDNRIQFVCRGS